MSEFFTVKDGGVFSRGVERNNFLTKPKKIDAPKKFAIFSCRNGNTSQHFFNENGKSEGWSVDLGDRCIVDQKGYLRDLRSDAEKKIDMLANKGFNALQGGNFFNDPQVAILQRRNQYNVFLSHFNNFNQKMYQWQQQNQVRFCDVLRQQQMQQQQWQIQQKKLNWQNLNSLAQQWQRQSEQQRQQDMLNWRRFCGC